MATGVTDKLEISLGDYPAKGEVWAAVLASDRQALVDLLEEVKDKWHTKSYLEITMPCGYSQRFTNNCDIPFEDLPCPCGQEGRYLIRYKKE